MSCGKCSKGCTITWENKFLLEIPIFKSEDSVKVTNFIREFMKARVINRSGYVSWLHMFWSLSFLADSPWSTASLLICLSSKNSISTHPFLLLNITIFCSLYLLIQKCRKCDSEGECREHITIQRPPRNLIACLQRFGPRKGKKDFQVALTPFLNYAFGLQVRGKGTPNISRYAFELFAVVCHTGKSHLDGQYYCCALYEATWFRFEDEEWVSAT